MKKFLSGLKFFVKVMLCLALIVVVYMISPIRFNLITSPSMKDVIPVYSTYCVNECFDMEELNIGDIIMYSTEEVNEPVVHRIVHKNEERGYFMTKGDNNETLDTWTVTEDMIIGKYVGHTEVLVEYLTYCWGYNYLGDQLFFLKKFVIISVPHILIIGYSTFYLVRGIKNIIKYIINKKKVK